MPFCGGRLYGAGFGLFPGGPARYRGCRGGLGWAGWGSFALGGCPWRSVLPLGGYRLSSRPLPRLCCAVGLRSPTSRGWRATSRRVHRSALLHIAPPTATVFGAMPIGGTFGELFGEVLRSLFSTIGSYIIGLTVDRPDPHRPRFVLVHRLGGAAGHGTGVAATRRRRVRSAVAGAWARRARWSATSAARREPRPQITTGTPRMTPLIDGAGRRSPPPRSHQEDDDEPAMLPVQRSRNRRACPQRRRHADPRPFARADGHDRSPRPTPDRAPRPRPRATTG